MAALEVLTIKDFIAKAREASFLESLVRRFKEVFEGEPASPQETASWANSLPALAALLAPLSLQGHILIEYPMPLGSRRADCLLVGSDAFDKSHVIVVELKQWSQGSVELNTSNDAGSLKVHTQGDGYCSDHPCEQALAYREAILHMLDFGSIKPEIHALAYLHNYKEVQGDLLRSNHYNSCLSNAQMLTQNTSNIQELSLTRQLLRPAPMIVQALASPKLKYSDAFITNFTEKLNCSALFKPTEEQKDAFRDILRSLSPAGRNTCFTVKGIVGTGKTVLAMMLIGHFMQRGLNPKYHVVSAAIRSCLGDLDFYSGGSASTDYLVVDEAHRLNTDSLPGLLSGKKLVVFFIDDNQWLQPRENCRSADIETFANAKGMRVASYTLATQLRCRGAAHYLAWVDNFFNRGRLLPLIKDEKFEVVVVDSPQQLEENLRQRAEGNSTCRMVAGYCWDWKTKSSSSRVEHDIEINGWTARWNKSGDYAKWNKKLGLHPEVGAIYTVQGFEYDYVGVIIGGDIVLTHKGLQVRQVNQKYDALRKSLQRTNVSEEQKRHEFARAVKNIYYVLLTRAKKGVFIYAVDPTLHRALLAASDA